MYLCSIHRKLGFKLSSPQQSHVIIHMTFDRTDLDSRVSIFKNPLHDVTIEHIQDSKCKEEDLLDFDFHLRGYNNAIFLSSVAQCSNVLIATQKESLQSKRKITGYAIAFLNKEKQIVLDGLFAHSDDVALMIFR